MPHAEIGPIAVHLPARVETNEMLKAEYPQWDIDQIEEKTGIKQRHIAEPGETSSDLAVIAAEKLFRQHNINRSEIDFVLLCTQTPDYPLPTTSCLVQDRLGLRTGCGAIDFNLGCSGYVYGLALADGLIQSGVAKKILFLTAETYSKYIDEDDRSLRTIFGDGAAASLITTSSSRSLWGFQFGSDGSGGDMLLVTDGGARSADDALKPRHRKRWKSRLYMDGPSLINFTVDAVPRLVGDILVANGLTDADGFRRFAAECGAPFMANMTQFGKTPYYTASEFEEMGCKLVIWPVSSLRAAAKAMEGDYAELKEKDTLFGHLDRTP